MAGTTLLLVGTRKGLWIGSADAGRHEWSWTGPHFQMEEVYSATVETSVSRLRTLMLIWNPEEPM